MLRFLNIHHFSKAIFHSLVFSSTNDSVDKSSIVAGVLKAQAFDILRIVLRKILPLLVLGSFSMNITPCSLQKAPTLVRMRFEITYCSFESSTYVKLDEPDPLSTTNAKGLSPFIGSSNPITALSTTLSTSFITSSRRPVLMRWPAVFITSSTLVII